MLGKMASAADGFLASAGQFKQGLRAAKYIEKGVKKPATDAAKDGFFSKAINSAKQTAVGTKLTANTGYKAQKEVLTDHSIDAVNRIKADQTKRGLDIAEELKGATDEKTRQTLSKNLEAINGQTSRMDGMLDNGYFEREFTKKEYLKDYFGDETYGSFRKKAAAGTGAAVGAGMLVGRFATGGSLTRNGNGDRDIVGIPLI